MRRIVKRTATKKPQLCSVAPESGTEQTTMLVSEGDNGGVRSSNHAGRLLARPCSPLHYEILTFSPRLIVADCLTRLH